MNYIKYILLAFCTIFSLMVSNVILGISVYFIKKYTRQGMPCVRYLKTKRYNINKVIEWLNKNNIEFKLNNNV